MWSRIFILSIISIVFHFGVLPQEKFKIVAKVNGEIITNQDINMYVQLIKLKVKDIDVEKLSDEELKEIALQNIIGDKLIISEAKSMSINIPDSFVNYKIREVLKGFENYSDFEDFLIREGLTVTQFKERIKEQLLLQEMINYKIRSQINVYPWEITDFYEKNKSLFVKDKEYVCKVIKVDSQEEAEKIKEEIEKKGIDNLDENYKKLIFSIVSDKENLQDEIYEAIKESTPGKVSIVEQNKKFFVVYLERINYARCLPIEKVRETVYNYVFQKKFKEALQNWMEELKEKAVIEVYEE